MSEEGIEGEDSEREGQIFTTGQQKSSKLHSSLFNKASVFLSAHTTHCSYTHVLR